MKFSVYLNRRVFVMFYQVFDAGKEIRAVFNNVSKALIEYGINVCYVNLELLVSA